MDFDEQAFFYFTMMDVKECIELFGKKQFLGLVKQDYPSIFNLIGEEYEQANVRVYQD